MRDLLLRLETREAAAPEGRAPLEVGVARLLLVLAVARPVAEVRRGLGVRLLLVLVVARLVAEARLRPARAGVRLVAVVRRGLGVRLRRVRVVVRLVAVVRRLLEVRRVLVVVRRVAEVRRLLEVRRVLVVVRRVGVARRLLEVRRVLVVVRPARRGPSGSTTPPAWLHRRRRRSPSGCGRTSCASAGDPRRRARGSGLPASPRSIRGSRHMRHRTSRRRCS